MPITELQDLCALKLSAVAGRGLKKNFYDVFYLLRSYSFIELFDFFKHKFPSTSTFQVIKSLTYFDDADMEPDSITLDSVEWEHVKRTIAEKLEEFLFPV